MGSWLKQGSEIYWLKFGTFLFFWKKTLDERGFQQKFILMNKDASEGTFIQNQRPYTANRFIWKVCKND